MLTKANDAPGRDGDLTSRCKRPRPPGQLEQCDEKVADALAGLWNGDLSADAVHQVLSGDEVVWHDSLLPGKDLTKLNDLQALVSTFRRALPNLTLTLHRPLHCGEGGVVLAYWSAKGTHSGDPLGPSLPPSGAQAAWEGSLLLRRRQFTATGQREQEQGRDRGHDPALLGGAREGVEVWWSWDPIFLFRQLGWRQEGQEQQQQDPARPEDSQQQQRHRKEEQRREQRGEEQLQQPLEHPPETEVAGGTPDPHRNAAAGVSSSSSSGSSGNGDPLELATRTAATARAAYGTEEEAVAAAAAAVAAAAAAMAGRLPQRRRRTVTNTDDGGGGGSAYTTAAAGSDADGNDDEVKEEDEEEEEAVLAAVQAANRAVVELYFHTYNTGHYAVLDHIVHPDYRYVGLLDLGGRRGRAAMAAMMGGWREPLPDLAIGHKLCAAVGRDKVAFRWVIQGTHTASGSTLLGVPARGARLLVKGVTTLTLRDGRIVRKISHANAAETLRQLGAAVPPVIPIVPYVRQ